MNKDKHRQEKKQESQERSWYLERECYRFLDRLLRVLNVSLDQRLVVTFLSLVMVILMHRHRHQGLLLSELGGYLRPAYQVPAGTKRISNLLHAKGWSAEIIDGYLWLQAGERVEALQQTGKTVLVVWDESVLEKAESLKLAGLCAVISSKARRLKRIKKGYFNPPGGRAICVPGYHWLQVLVMGMEGSGTVAKMRWWTTRGEQAMQLRAVEAEVMDEVARAWANCDPCLGSRLCGSPLVECGVCT